MALETKRRVAFGEHLRVDRPVGVVARRTSLAQRFMLESEWTPLRLMTGEAAFILGKKRSAAGEISRALVGRMAIRAAEFPFRNRVVARQAELAPDVTMALEADRLQWPE